MTTNFIPTIGDRGFYQLLEPFQTDSRKIQTCDAIRKISELISDNIDVFAKYYAPKSISIDIFEEDLKENRAIVFLLNDDGSYEEVPIRYLAGYPNMNGVPYQGVALVVSLPAFPIDTDFALFETMIKQQALETLGVEVSIKPVRMSAPVLRTTEEHTAASADRTLRATAGTDYSRAIDWRTKYTSLKFQYDQLISGVNWS